MSDKVCEKCGEECFRDEVDVGVGTVYGPWGCPACGWSEWSEYDRSGGVSPKQWTRESLYVVQHLLAMAGLTAHAARGTNLAGKHAAVTRRLERLEAYLVRRCYR